MKSIKAGRISLRWTLVLYVLVPLASAMALTGYFALKLWEQQVEARMQSDLEMVARAIQLPLSHAMEKQRQGGMDQTLASAISMDSVYSAYAYDMEGRRIASAGDKDPDPMRGKLTELAAEGKRKGEYGRVGKRRVYSYFVPLVDSRNQVAGLLQLTRRERDFRRYIANVRHHALLWLGLGASAIVFLVLVGQHQALGCHFEKLTLGMQRVASGETGYRLPVSGPREIAAISGNFNSMLDNIQQAEHKIETHRREQAALENQLRHAEKMAAVGQLAAGVAHELGTPLSTISGTAQRTLRHEKNDSLSFIAFHRILGEIVRMETIIRQLLDFSHTSRLRPRSLRPAIAAASAATAVHKEAEQSGASIALHGEAEAPSFSADPIRTEQVLVNLLRNALQSAPGVHVRLGWKVDGKHMVFTVDDNGPGIPEAIRPRLFEPFFTTKNVGAGTGLGLAVVHGIVTEHGGAVQAGESDLGGARFTIRLPIHAATDRSTSS
ncbi:MAG: HAMP domain-containing histidine kinase [Spartobacteria bacterium]|nr:HAMP domain-containing histidine kinase [Spartobacteria bacterium]